MKKKTIRHRPSTWEQITDIRIVDPDGWRGKWAQSWTKPISRAEWHERTMISTIRPGPKANLTDLGYPHNPLIVK